MHFMTSPIWLTVRPKEDNLQICNVCPFDKTAFAKNMLLPRLLL